ncbi:MAG: zinc ribbon domain-containing protein [Anaerolineae bacterium]
MARVERICPNCGTSNASVREQCRKCGTRLSLHAPREDNLPGRSKGVRTVALVLSAGAIIARTGLRLFVKQVLPRIARMRSEKPSHMTIDYSPRQPPVENAESRQPESPEPDSKIHGWRAWRVRHGDKQASGSKTVEWSVSRRREGGAGKE